MAAKQQRIFGMGGKVRIAKKSRVVDKGRAHEGLSEEDKHPIDQDVTGEEGEICGGEYQSTTKDGEYCVPIKLKNGAVVGVPETRLEPVQAGRAPRSGYSRRYSENIEKIFKNKKRNKS